jgi:hypothetical protein
MTAEELAAAGLPAEPVVEGPENAPPPKEGGSPIASDSRSHEDGEVRKDEEDIRDVDDGVGDLVRTSGTSASFSRFRRIEGHY